MLQIPSLISFWDFQRQNESLHTAKGPYPYVLREMEGPIDRDGEGVFGAQSLCIKPGQWLSLPRADAPALNIHGQRAEVTVVAWIKWNNDTRCQFVAGMWNETDKKRQYGLFLNLSGRYESFRNVHGHVSGRGGPTPGDRYCVTYSTGKSEVPFDEWKTVAMSYDGNYSRVYVDGILDQRDKYNPYPYDEGIFDGGVDGSDFTVGSCSAAGRMNNFFGGLIGGVAVFDKRLSEVELKGLVMNKPQSRSLSN